MDEPRVGAHRVEETLEGSLDASVTTASLDLTFEESFDDLFRRAYTVGYQLLGVRAEAEDVAQEALARAFSRWRQVRGYSEPWVVRVAGNLAIGRWRKTRRLTALDARDDRPHAGPDAQRIDLHRALRKLSRRQREVVVLRYLADLSEADVARALDCSPGTVKQHASRGLAALREEIGMELS